MLCHGQVDGTKLLKLRLKHFAPTGSPPLRLKTLLRQWECGKAASTTTSIQKKTCSLLLFVALRKKSSINFVSCQIPIFPPPKKFVVPHVHTYRFSTATLCMPLCTSKKLLAVESFPSGQQWTASISTCWNQLCAKVSTVESFLL